MLEYQRTARDPQLASIVANRGGAFLIRFGARGEVADCSAAVTAYRRAVDLVGAHRLERARYLGQLSQSLRARHQATGSAADLYEAVTVLRESVHAVAPEHPDRAVSPPGSRLNGTISMPSIST